MGIRFFRTRWAAGLESKIVLLLILLLNLFSHKGLRLQRHEVFFCGLLLRAVILTWPHSIGNTSRVCWLWKNFPVSYFLCNVCFSSEKGDKRGYYDTIENILQVHVFICKKLLCKSELRFACFMSRRGQSRRPLNREKMAFSCKRHVTYICCSSCHTGFIFVDFLWT